VQFDELYVVVLADLTHRLIDGLSQLRVQEGVDLGIGIALLQHVQQAGQCTFAAALIGSCIWAKDRI
jgi:hypothetical protein